MEFIQLVESIAKVCFFLPPFSAHYYYLAYPNNLSLITFSVTLSSLYGPISVCNHNKSHDERLLVDCIRAYYFGYFSFVCSLLESFTWS